MMKLSREEILRRAKYRSLSGFRGNALQMSDDGIIAEALLIGYVLLDDSIGGQSIDNSNPFDFSEGTFGGGGASGSYDSGSSGHDSGSSDSSSGSCGGGGGGD